VTPITAQVSGVARRLEDDLILATAASAQVEFLITGDKRLQALVAYRGVAIVSPRESLEALMQRNEGDIGSV
jgi:predicted nucleic acid-binding protein